MLTLADAMSGGPSGLVELGAMKHVSSLFGLLVVVWPVTSQEEKGS